MPTYAYRCPHCSRQFEQFQKITEPPTAPCPDCGRPAERRITGGAGLLFKGSGFYITDYRTPGYKAAEKKEKGETPSESKKASADGSASKTEAREGTK